MPKVIIIGAGAAGLTAASALHRQGVEVMVLEARDRIGGRIFTMRDIFDGAPVDLGAEFVHGRPPAILDLAKSARWRLVECPDQRWLRTRKGLEPLNDFWEILERVNVQIDPHATSTYRAFLARAQASQFEKQIAKSYVEGFNAAHAGKISASAVALEDEAAEEI